MRIQLVVGICLVVVLGQFQTVFAQEKNQGLSIEELSELTGNSGKRRDIWLDPKDDGSIQRQMKGAFSLESRSTYFTMIDKAGFKKTLEFTDDQIKEFDKEKEEVTQQLIALWKKHSTASKSKQKEIAAQAAAAIVDFDASVKGIMLPHQTRMLQQILSHHYVRRESLFLAIRNGVFGEQFDFRKDQDAKMQEEARELAEELGEDVNKLKRKVLKRMLSHLDAGQKKLLEEHLGKDYESEVTPSLERLLNDLKSFGK